MVRSWSLRNPVLHTIALFDADACLIIDVLRALPFASNGPTSASRTLGVTIQSAAKAAVARGSFAVDGVVGRSAERRLVPSELSGADRGPGRPGRSASRHPPGRPGGVPRGRYAIDSYVKPKK